MLTGGKGIHVIAPLDATADWTKVKSFAERFSRAIAEAEPEMFTANIRKNQRKGRIFLDWLRNQRGATAVLPYSAAALVCDGQLIAAVAEERLTRVKHQGGVPRKAVQFCLEAEGISVSAGDKALLEDATIVVERGEKVGLVGPNGSGKTTLLLALLGGHPFDAGAARLAVDLSGVSFMDSITLAALLAVRRRLRAEARLAIVAAHGSYVRLVLEASGLLGVFDVFETEGEAIGFALG